jgi:hypothetical protein
MRRESRLRDVCSVRWIYLRIVKKETVRINSPALDMKGRIADESASGTL